MTDELPSLKEITDSPRWAELDPEQKRKVMDGWHGEALKQAAQTEGFTPEHASKLGQAVQTAYQMSVPFEPVATRTPGQIGPFTTGRVDILNSSLAQPVMAPVPTIAGTGPDLEPVGGPQTWGEFLTWSPLQEYGVQLTPKQVSEHPLLVGIDDLVGKQQADEIRKGIGEGVSEQVNGLLNFFTSAPGVALLATGSYGAPARKLIGAAFTGAIVKELPNQVSDFMAAKTPSEKWRTGVHLVSSALLGGGIGANVIARSRAIPGATEQPSQPGGAPPGQPSQPSAAPPPPPLPLRPSAGMSQAEFNAFMNRAHAEGNLDAATEAVKMNGGKRFSNWSRSVKGSEGFDFAQGVIKGWGNQQWAEFKAQRATPPKPNEPPTAEPGQPGVESTKPVAGPPQGGSAGTPVGTRPQGTQGTGGRTGVSPRTGSGTGPGGTGSTLTTLEELAPQTAAVVKATEPTPTGVTPNEIAKPSNAPPESPATAAPTAAGGTTGYAGTVSAGVPAAESGRQGLRGTGAAGTGEQQAAVTGGAPNATPSGQIQGGVPGESARAAPGTTVPANQGEVRQGEGQPAGVGNRVLGGEAPKEEVTQPPPKEVTPSEKEVQGREGQVAPTLNISDKQLARSLFPKGEWEHWSDTFPDERGYIPTVTVFDYLKKVLGREGFANELRKRMEGEQDFSGTGFEGIQREDKARSILADVAKQIGIGKTEPLSRDNAGKVATSLIEGGLNRKGSIDAAAQHAGVSSDDVRRVKKYLLKQGNDQLTINRQAEKIDRGWADEELGLKREAQPPMGVPSAAPEATALTEPKPPEQITPEEYYVRDLLTKQRTDASGKVLFDISEWSNASKKQASRMDDIFVYHPEKTDLTIAEFKKGTKPEEAAQILAGIIKEADGPTGTDWLPINQLDAIKRAAKEGKPLLKETLDAWGYSPPKKYTQSGEYYVVEGKAAPRPAEAASAGAPTEAPAAETPPIRPVTATAEMLKAMEVQRAAQDAEKTFSIPTFEQAGVSKATIKQLVKAGFAKKETDGHKPTMAAAAELSHAAGNPFWPDEFPKAEAPKPAAEGGLPVGTKIGREGYVWEKRADGWYSSDGVRQPKVDAWAEKQATKPEKNVRVIVPEGWTKRKGVWSGPAQKPAQTAPPEAAAGTQLAEAPKKPWQMTAKEVLEQQSAGIKKAKQEVAQAYSDAAKSPTQYWRDNPDAYVDQHAKGALIQSERKVPTLEEVKQGHRLFVEQAIAEGKPVPAEVLADYPDLKAAAEAPKPPEAAARTDRFQMTEYGMVMDTLYHQTITHPKTDPRIAKEALDALNKSDLNGKYVNPVTLAADESGRPILTSAGLKNDIILGESKQVEAQSARERGLTIDSIASAIERGPVEPPVKEGYIRLYRGEDSGGKGPKDETSGRFWSKDAREAEEYGDRMWYLDVPESMVGKKGTQSENILMANKELAEYDAKLLQPGIEDLGPNGVDIFMLIEAGKHKEAAKLYRESSAARTTEAPAGNVAETPEPPEIARLRSRMEETRSELQAARDAQKAGFGDEETGAEIHQLETELGAIRRKITRLGGDPNKFTPRTGPDPESGGVDPVTLQHIAQVVLFALAGATEGETKEERIRNALIGAGLGAFTGWITRRALLRLKRMAAHPQRAFMVPDLIERGLRYQWMERPAELLMKQPGTAPLGTAMRQWRNDIEDFQGKTRGEVEIKLREMSGAERKQAGQDFENYMAALRPPGAHPTAADITAAQNRAMIVRNGSSAAGKTLIDTVRAAYQFTGDTNQTIGVKVFDPAKTIGPRGGQHGGWRPIGNIGANLDTRIVRPEIQRVMDDPSSNPVLWNQFVDALIANGNITTAAEAEAYVKSLSTPQTSNEHFKPMEVARTTQLPHMAYDNSIEANLNFMDRWANRAAQIKNFGQVTHEGTSDLFTKTEQDIVGLGGKEYIRGLQDRIYNVTPNTLAQRNISRLNAIATGTQLANPRTIGVNLASGAGMTWYTLGFPGARALSDAIAKRKESDVDARRLGIVRDSILGAILDRDMDLQRAIDRGISAATDIQMKYSGYNALENFTRRHAMLGARLFLDEFLRNARTDPFGRRTLQMVAFLKRNKYNANELVAENGAGPKTDEFVRDLVRKIQGGYMVDQVPGYSDTWAGKFFLKYMKFGIQWYQNWTRNVIHPLIGDKVTVSSGGTTVTKTVRDFGPFFRWLATGILVGEGIDAFKRYVLGLERFGPSAKEIKVKFENGNVLRGFTMLGQRAVEDMVFSGMLGVLATPIQMFKAYESRVKFRDPLKPPGLAIVQTLIDFLGKFIEQGKTIMAKDVDELAAGMSSTYRDASEAAKHVAGEFGSKWNAARVKVAEDTVRLARRAARRYAEDQGIPLPVDTTPGRTGKTIETPFRDQLENALLLGEEGVAAYLVKQRVMQETTTGDAKKVLASIRQAVTSRQPIKVGTYAGAERRIRFMEWAKQNLDPGDVNRIRALDTTYRDTAEKLGLIVESDELDDEQLMKKVEHEAKQNTPISSVQAEKWVESQLVPRYKNVRRGMHVRLR